MTVENRQKIGALLKMERRKAGISQDEMARKSGLTQTTVSHLESGDSDFRIKMLESDVDALGKKLNLISKDAELFHYNAAVQSV